MLSIRALGSWQSAAAYYEHLQEGQSRKLEDYYSGDHPGRYTGAGAAALGLSGQVKAEMFTELCKGFTPKGAAQNAGKDDHRSGWDMTFSAPKSVSVIWGTASPELREQIEQVHSHAVDLGLQFMERHAAVTRRGAGSKFSDSERDQNVGLIAAVYNHGTSREQDPQLHSHCVIFNVAPRSDGSVGALDSYPMYSWKMAGGAAYRAELARGLKDLGFNLERDEKTFRVTEVPQELEDEFSKRRKQIKRALAEHGACGAKASEIATLATRKAKVEINRDVLLTRWQKTAHEVAPGWSADAIRRPGQQQQSEVLDIKAVQKELTRENSTLTEAQLFGRVAIERQLSGGISEIEKSVAAVRKDQETVILTDDGRARFSTREMVKIEAQMVEDAKAMQLQHNHSVDRQKLEAAIRQRPTMSREQRDAVRHITREGDLSCMTGMAGTGKSFALGAAREAWQAQGFRVRGAALSGKAAQELQNGSRIESTTLKKLEMETRGFDDDDGKFHEARDKLTSRDIIVLDEAGMIGSRDMSALISDAKQTGAKIVLVGDSRQIQSIEAGAAFRAIEQRTGSASLSNIRRQNELADRVAVKDLAAGRADKAMESFEARGRVHVENSAREAKAEMGAAIAQDLQQGKLSLGLTGTRVEARDVNESAREAAKEKGLIHGEEITVGTHAGERDFAAGDRVLFTRNNTSLEVKNGDLGTVQSVADVQGEKRVVVQLDRGGEREINPASYDHVEYGYAVTVHKSQGSTVDRAHILASENAMSSREWAYVAGSRAREETHVHGDRYTLSDIAPRWARARQKDVSLDYEVKDLRERKPETAHQKHEHEQTIGMEFSH